MSCADILSISPRSVSAKHASYSSSCEHSSRSSAQYLRRASHHHNSRSATAASTAASASPASHCLLRPPRHLPSRPHKQRLRAAAWSARNKLLAACLALVLLASATLSREQRRKRRVSRSCPSRQQQPTTPAAATARAPLQRNHPEVVRLPYTRSFALHGGLPCAGALSRSSTAARTSSGCRHLHIINRRQNKQRLPTSTYQSAVGWGNNQHPVRCRPRTLAPRSGRKTSHDWQTILHVSQGSTH